MKFIPTLLFLALLLFSKVLVGQDQKKIDSLLSVYNSQPQDSSKVKTAHAIYDFYYGHKPKIALKYSKQGLQLAQKINYKTGIAKSFYHHGRQLRNLRKLDSSMYYFDKAFNIYKEIGDAHEQGMMVYNKSIINYFMTNYSKALDDISKSILKYSKPKPDSIVIMNLIALKGRIYMRQTKYKQGIESTLEALEYAKKLKSENKKAQIISALSSLYHYTNNYEKAITYKQQALRIYQKQNR